MVPCDTWLDTAGGCHWKKKKRCLASSSSQKEGDKDNIFLVTVKCKKNPKTTQLKTEKINQPKNTQNNKKPKPTNQPQTHRKLLCKSVVCAIVAQMSLPKGEEWEISKTCAGSIPEKLSGYW